MTHQQAISAAITAAGSMEKLAVFLDVSFATIYAWAKGKRTPSRLHRVRLAGLARKKGWSAEIASTLERVIAEARP